MYKINTANGAIHCPDGYVCLPPYDDQDLPHYLEYADWVNSGNSPVEFYEEPSKPVPEVVSRFQALASLALNNFLDQVQQYMSSGNVGIVDKLAWENATEFSRSSSLVNGVANHLGLTSDQIDELFRQAVEIKT